MQRPAKPSRCSAADLPAGEDATLAALAARLGEWPLLLRLVHGMLRDRIVHAGPRCRRHARVSGTVLDHRGLTGFDPPGLRRPAPRRLRPRWG